MRRYMARCLNVESRIRPITEGEVEKAFQRVKDGQPTVASPVY